MIKKTDFLGLSYYDTLPKGAMKVSYLSEFFTLKQGKRKFVRDNIDLVIGSELLIESNTKSKYWVRIIKEWHNPLTSSSIASYLERRLLYIIYSKEVKEKLTAQFNNQPLTYNSWVRINDLTLDMELLETQDRFSEGVISKKKRIEDEINMLSKNLRK